MQKDSCLTTPAVCESDAAQKLFANSEEPDELGRPLPLEPFVFTESAVCIRDSEGSFNDRRERLKRALQHSRTITKMHLIQRNIFQGVNVVRRGVRMLEPLIERRPLLSYMVSANKLPPDYIDKVFPSDPAQCVAPHAERIERVSLHRLLAPSLPDHASQAGALASFASAGPAKGNLDPAMLAAMVVQAAMSQRQQMVPAHGVMPPQAAMTQTNVPQAQLDAVRQAMVARQLPMAQMAAAAVAAASMASVSSTGPAGGSPSSTAGSTARPPQADAEANAGSPAAWPQTSAGPLTSGNSTAGSSTGTSTTGRALTSSTSVVNQAAPAPIGSGSPSPTRRPKPSLQAQRRTPQTSRRTFKPPFVRLIEEFCDRALGQEAASASATGMQNEADQQPGT